MTELTEKILVANNLNLGPKPPPLIRSGFIPAREYPSEEMTDELRFKVSSQLNQAIAVMKKNKLSTANYVEEYGLDNSFPPTEDKVAEAFQTGVAAGDFIVALHPYSKPKEVVDYCEIDRWERPDEKNPGKTKPAVKVVFFHDFLSGVPQVAQEQVMTSVVMDAVRKNIELINLRVMEPSPASANLIKPIEIIPWQTPFLPK